MRIGNVAHHNLSWGQPNRQGASVLFDQNTDETLHAAHNGSVQHDGAMASAILSDIFGIQALGSKSDYDAAPSRDGLDKVERQALLADMSFAVALTFGITGAVLLFGDDEAGKPTASASKTNVARPTLAPFVSPTARGAAASFRF